MVVKRTFDVLVSAVLLLALSPALFLVALAVRLDSGGPIIYRGRRTGLNGQPFHVLKFRSMRPDAEARGGTTTGLNDVRVTRVGRALRRYKLDELPQLINVLKGDMSLVGPRPEVEEYTRLYDEEERAILSVRPGITDFASLHFIDLAATVGGEDADHAYRTRVLGRKNALRLRYVRERSFALDLSILAMTAWALAGKVANGMRHPRA